MLTRIIGLLVLILLQGCSAIRLVYGQAPDLGYWWADAYVDFTADQSLRVREDLLALQQWHRSTQLPDYADWLLKLEALSAAPTDAAQVCKRLEEVRQRLLLVLERAEPGLAWLALQLTPEQLQHMEARFTKSNADWRSDWLEGTEQERRRKRYRLLLDRSESLYGRLGDAQKTVLRSSLDASAFDPQLAWAERQRRQQDMLATLRQLAGSGKSQSEAQEAIRALAQRSLNSPQPAYRQHAEALVREGCNTYAGLHNSTTPAQREKAAQTLRGYAEDLRVLAARKN